MRNIKTAPRRANKAERLAAIKSGAIKYTSFEYTEESISVNPDGNGATGVFKITAKGTMKGKPMDPATRTTGVFAKTKDGWKLMSATNAKMDEKAKADDKAKVAEPQKATGNAKIDAMASDDAAPPPAKKK